MDAINTEHEVADLYEAVKSAVSEAIINHSDDHDGVDPIEGAAVLGRVLGSFLGHCITEMEIPEGERADFVGDAIAAAMGAIGDGLNEHNEDGSGPYTVKQVPPEEIGPEIEEGAAVNVVGLDGGGPNDGECLHCYLLTAAQRFVRDGGRGDDGYMARAFGGAIGDALGRRLARLCPKNPGLYAGKVWREAGDAYAQAVLKQSGVAIERPPSN